MAKTRQQVCDRVLRMLNKTDGDAPADAGDIQIVNGLIEPVIARLSRQNLVDTSIDLGTSSDLSTGTFPDSLFLPICQTLTLAAAPDFGAPLNTYKSLSDMGEQTLASLRYRKDKTGSEADPIEGTLRDLCYRVLKMVKTINENDIPTDDALKIVNQLIRPTADELKRRGVLLIGNLGSSSNLDSGQIPESEIIPFAQVLSRATALALGPPFFQGNLADYIQLATEGEQRLRNMRQEIDIGEPIYARYY
jgi:hypothetical protein